ncbi:putative kinase [Ascosphaera atra]|nr:putative kinase [Ascosphaera atra]
MDGYHLYRSELAAMPDPEYAAARRGAAFTFNAEKFLGLVKRLREPLTPESKTIYAPSFDHAVKDPVENDVPIEPSVRVLFFEGNYLSLNKHPWTECAALFDELWFVQVDFEVARKRLVARHLAAGLAPTYELADKRAVENDLVNGQEIVDNMLKVDEVIVSTEDQNWASA